MAEVRKHNPDDGDGLGKLVRDALGESIRPTPPGQHRGQNEKEEPEVAPDEPKASSLPVWPSDGPTFTF